MSFREKSAWISLLCLVVIYGYYFLQVAASPQLGHGALLVRVVIVLIIVEAVLISAVAARHPREANAPADERERLIALKAARLGFYVLTVATLAVCAAMALGLSGSAAANHLFLAIVIGEAARNAGQIAYSRIGA